METAHKQNGSSSASARLKNNHPAQMSLEQIDRTAGGELASAYLTGLESLFDTESLLHTLFYHAADLLSDSQLQQHFKDPTITLRQRLGVLRFLSTDERLETLQGVFTLARSRPEPDIAIERKMNNMIHLTTIPERSELISNLLTMPLNRTTTRLIAAILRTSMDLRELETVVSAVGIERLRAVRSRAVREFVAHAEIGSALQLLHLPKPLSTNATHKQVTLRIAALRKALRAEIDMCKNTNGLSKTEVVREATRRANYNLRFLTDTLPGIRKLRDRRTFVNTLLKKIDIECRYGVLLSVERGRNGTYARAWSDSDLKQIESVLSRIPQGTVLFTPKLTEIQRTLPIGDNILADRDYETGLIRIGDATLTDAQSRADYDNIDPFESTLCHEIGHGIQQGIEQDITVEAETGKITGPADPIYDFADFLDLSDWRAVNRHRYTTKGSPHHVVLDGKRVLLDRPIKLDGNEVVLVHDEITDQIYSYRKDAAFSLGVRFRTLNPWEDWVEAFTEYIYLPERLITYAPQKFIYFEQELRKYEDEPDLLEKLNSRLMRQSPSSTNGVRQYAAE